MSSPKRLVRLKKQDKTPELLQISQTRSGSSEEEFDFSKFVLENPDNSFAKDSSTKNDTSPTPVTVVEIFHGVPEYDLQEMIIAESFQDDEQSPLSEPMESEPEEEEVESLSEVEASSESSDTHMESEDSDASDLSSHFQPSKAVLDYSGRLYRLLHQTPPTMKKPPKESPTFSIAIDPHVVGLATMNSILREHTILQDELKRNRATTECLQLTPPRVETCDCDLPYHPRHWTDDIIEAVHNYSYLLDCKDLDIEEKYVFGSNARRTIVFLNVPMVDGHPWKKKAEQALRFTDVEAGNGDQTPFDLLYYRQPNDRKIFLIIASHKVIGLVVAEELLTANRVKTDFPHLRILEDSTVPVRVGINRLWIHVSMRRNHLATVLCDFVGLRFYKGEVLKKEDYAFNSNFCSGLGFPKRYLKVRNVPLYLGKVGIKL